VGKAKDMRREQAAKIPKPMEVTEVGMERPAGGK